MLVLLPLAAGAVAILLGGIFVAGLGLAELRFAIPEPVNTRTVTMRGGLFGPVLAIVHVGDTVTWTNLDSSAHSVVAYPTNGTSFCVPVAAGDSGAVTFSRPGVYRYYSREDACYDAALNSVEANLESPGFPAPMCGVVVVLDVRDAVPLSASATVTIPVASRMFEPWAVTVKTGSTVTWVNRDCSMHVVATVPELAAAAVPTLSLPGDGGTASHTFWQPGVYYYDCSGNAMWDPGKSIMVPLENYDSYPHVMDGLVIVTP